MKKIVLAASAALLIAAPSLSFAQDDHRHEGGGHPGGGAPSAHAPSAPQARPGGQGGYHSQGAPAPGGQGGYHPQGGPAPGGQGGYRPSGQRPTFPGGQGGYRPQPGQSGFQSGQPNGYHSQSGPAPGGQGGYRPQPGQPGFQGGGHHGDRQSGQGFGSGYRGGQLRSGGQVFGYGGRQYFRYRAAPYRYPGGYYGWADHSWRRGEWLPSVFIASDYFINDWSDFGLWQPDYGYEWIRVGADAVLVNLADGQVVDVVPGVYYD